jgi:phage host-nuclease inhibitor protein Gam
MPKSPLSHFHTTPHSTPEGENEPEEKEIAEREGFMRSIQGRSIADPVHPEHIRYEAKWTKQRHNSLKRLSGLETMNGSGPPPPPSDVIHGALMVARKFTGEEIDVEGLTLPGVGEDEAVEELSPMKVSDVRACIEEIARYAEANPDELLEQTTWEAALDTRRSAHRLEETEREIDRRSRERLLPDTGKLEKIARYEAHLSKQLYTALHELEALQKRRLTGEDSPLARLEVNGPVNGYEFHNAEG